MVVLAARALRAPGWLGSWVACTPTAPALLDGRSLLEGPAPTAAATPVGELPAFALVAECGCPPEGSGGPAPVAIAEGCVRDELDPGPALAAIACCGVDGGVIATPAGARCALLASVPVRAWVGAATAATDATPCATLPAAAGTARSATEATAGVAAASRCVAAPATLAGSSPTVASAACTTLPSASATGAGVVCVTCASGSSAAGAEGNPEAGAEVDAGATPAAATIEVTALPAAAGAGAFAGAAGGFTWETTCATAPLVSATGASANPAAGLASTHGPATAANTATSQGHGSGVEV